MGNINAKTLIAAVAAVAAATATASFFTYQTSICTQEYMSKKIQQTQDEYCFRLKSSDDIEIEGNMGFKIKNQVDDEGKHSSISFAKISKYYLAYYQKPNNAIHIGIVLENDFTIKDNNQSYDFKYCLIHLVAANIQENGQAKVINQIIIEFQNSNDFKENLAIIFESNQENRTFAGEYQTDNVKDADKSATSQRIVDFIKLILGKEFDINKINCGMFSLGAHLALSGEDLSKLDKQQLEEKLKETKVSYIQKTPDNIQQMLKKAKQIQQ
ncbi:hypothetical protein ABPG72_013587 [Tetrahymena utriculariae]